MSAHERAGQEDRRHDAGRFSQRGLHLLWTVPVAFAAGYVPASLARFERCGINRCLGDPGGFASPSATPAITVAIAAGLVMFAALALTPWLRPLWLRLSIGLAISLLVASFWVWKILFTR
jgi:hypothetical protein